MTMRSPRRALRKPTPNRPVTMSQGMNRISVRTVPPGPLIAAATRRRRPSGPTPKNSTANRRSGDGPRSTSAGRATGAGPGT